MKKELIFIALALILSFALSRIAGHFYYDPRPFVVGGFTPRIPHVPDNGFPSDHTLLFATLAAILWYYSKKYAVGLWIVALGVGAYRVYGGVHHWRDIAGSLVIALAAAFVARAIIGRLWKHMENPSSSSPAQ